MTQAHPYLSIAAPCYNEEEVLPEFYRRVTAAAQAFGATYELVLINDGSKDRTWAMIADLARTDPHVVGVNLSRNHGHQRALTAGLSVCLGERIMVIDADLQDPPELLPNMMKLMDEGADVVYGQRQQRAGETGFKLLTAAGFYWLINKLSDTPIPSNTGDFRLMSRRVMLVLQDMPERHRFIRGMVSWIGFKQVPLLYNRDARFAGETKYPLRKMVKFATDAVTAFSIKPLTFAVTLGFGAAMIAALLVLYSLIMLVSGKTVPGWSSIVAAIAFFSAIQLIVIGIFGEYLGRLYEQSKGRPLFIIQDVVRGEQGAAPGADRRPPSVSPGTKGSAHE